MLTALTRRSWAQICLIFAFSVFFIILLFRRSFEKQKHIQELRAQQHNSYVCHENDILPNHCCIAVRRHHSGINKARTRLNSTKPDWFGDSVEGCAHHDSTNAGISRSEANRGLALTLQNSVPNSRLASKITSSCSLPLTGKFRETFRSVCTLAVG